MNNIIESWKMFMMDSWMLCKDFIMGFWMACKDSENPNPFLTAGTALGIIAIAIFVILCITAVVWDFLDVDDDD